MHNQLCFRISYQRPHRLLLPISATTITFFEHHSSPVSYNARASQSILVAEASALYFTICTILLIV